MKYLTLIVLLFSSHLYANLGATVSGTTISWPDTGGWMQVQNSNDYSTACDGFIFSCDVSIGAYHIIDHSSFTRQDNVIVSFQENLNSDECAGSEVTVQPAPLFLNPPIDGFTVFYSHYFLTDRIGELNYIGVLGWASVEGADGYDVYMNGEYHGTSVGTSDNGGYSFTIDPSELPAIEFPDCPRCVDTLLAGRFTAIMWTAVAWNDQNYYSAQSLPANFQFAPEHPTVARLLPVMDSLSRSDTSE